jgi:hypothetical protein
LLKIKKIEQLQQQLLGMKKKKNITKDQEEENLIVNRNEQE